MAEPWALPLSLSCVICWVGPNTMGWAIKVITNFLFCFICFILCGLTVKAHYCIYTIVQYYI
ncbi:pollen-specific leucine-rich repeat extensin-like protein 3 [Iris pallida]|uniref:Pollen-specific leucine-rich repeat extensin-like protein 3 n=1 Tax=Iris pallida TaxID=29817 RepID=A0AAX6EWZ5_IRIPA|nr:pollen-specific leucine-rich repeat extensin-like protein 3 [Iris pallida]